MVNWGVCRPACCLASLSAIFMASFLSGCGGRNSQSDALEQTSSIEVSPDSKDVEQPASQSPKETAPGPLPFSTPGAEIPLAQPERISSTTMQLWKQLVHPESENAGWESTFEAFVSLDHDAVPLLKIKLRTGDPLEREMASTVLAQLGPIADGAADELTRALADPSVYVRANVAATLVQLPGSADRAVPVLIQLLGSSEPELRQLAVTNLTMAGSAVTPYSAELLAAVTRLTDQDSRVQVLSILQSLRENGGEPTRVLESADSFQLTGGSANSDGESEPEISGF